jgi:hypothetical protein
MGHSSYNLDLAHSDFNLFEPMKVHLEGQKFETDNELRCGVLNWQQS